MNTKAIYTIRENLEDSHFYTEFAGGCSFPFAVAENLNTANEAVRHLCGFQQVRTAELMRLITGDDNRLPLDAHGERLFIPLSEADAKDYLERFEREAEIPYHITLDMDIHMAGFEFNPQCQNSLPDLCFPMYGKADYSGTALWSRSDDYRLTQICKGRPVGDLQVSIEVQEEGFRQCFHEYAQRIYGEATFEIGGEPL